MQIPENLDAPLVASLRSVDGFHSIRFFFHGYQFLTADETSLNWYRITFEYRAGTLLLQNKTCAFDAASFERFAKALSRFEGARVEPRMLLYPPYGSEIELQLKSETPKVRTIRTRKGEIYRYKFARKHSGLFVLGEVCGFKFRFRVRTVELKRCRDVIAEVVKTYPTRYRPSPSADINPVAILESKFQGVAVRADVSNWMTDWLEGDIKRAVQPLVRAVKRHARRQKLTKADLSTMLTCVDRRCRSTVIKSYRK